MKGLHLQAFQQQPGLLQGLPGGEQPELPPRGRVTQHRSPLGEVSQGGEVTGSHGVDQGRRVQGVGSGCLSLPGQADQHHGPQVKACRRYAPSGLQHTRGVHPLAHRPQHRVAAALHPQVETHQPRPAEGRQLFLRLAQGAARAGIGVDPLEGGEGLVQPVQDGQ